MKNKGFTLLEMITVILIIGIISLIATPIFNNIIKDGREASYKSSMASIIKELESYAIANPGTDFSTPTSIDIEDINISDKSTYSGSFILEDGYIVLVDVTNEEYCANGNKNNLTIEKGNCN